MGRVMERSLESESEWQIELDRCRHEIASIEAMLLGRHPDLYGLCLALADWSTELKILQKRHDDLWRWRNQWPR
jgi:hypothetical protein